MALQKSFDMEDEAQAALYSPRVGAWSRLYRYVDWDEETLNPEPELLEEAVGIALFQEHWNNVDKFIVTPSAQVIAARALRPKRRR